MGSNKIMVIMCPKKKGEFKMAHTCPVCGAICYCNGDIDDVCLDLEEDILNCTHCDEHELDCIDDEADYDSVDSSGYNWCNFYNCWCSDAEDITDGRGDCNYNCKDCEHVEKVNSKR